MPLHHKSRQNTALHLSVPAGAALMLMVTAAVLLNLVLGQPIKAQAQQLDPGEYEDRKAQLAARAAQPFKDDGMRQE